MESRSAAALARYIVDDNNGPYGIKMTEEEKKSRREYLREKLKGTVFNDYSNDQLDKSRYIETESVRIFSDFQKRDYALGIGIHRKEESNGSK